MEEDKISLDAVSMYFPIKYLRIALDHAMTQPESTFKWRETSDQNLKTTVISSKSTDFLRIDITCIELYLHDGVYVCRLDIADRKHDESNPRAQTCIDINKYETETVEKSNRTGKSKPVSGGPKANVVRKRKRGRPPKIESKTSRDSLCGKTSPNNSRDSICGKTSPNNDSSCGKTSPNNSRDSICGKTSPNNSRDSICGKTSQNNDYSCGKTSPNNSRDSICGKTAPNNSRDSICGKTSPNNSRYNLRGVKLSPSIILAEKGIYTNNIDSELSKDHLTCLKNRGHGQIGAQHEKKQNQETHIDIICNDDLHNTIETEPVAERLSGNSDFENDLCSKEQKCLNVEKHVRKPQKRHEHDHDDEFVPVKRIYMKLNLGDEIPKFERRNKQTAISRKCEPCKICNKMLSDYTGVYFHVKNMHATDPTLQSYLEELSPLKIETCATCGSSCSDRFLLQAHEDRYHKKNIAVECNQCKKIFKNVTSLRNHVRSIHNLESAKSHLCHLCSAKFKFANTLKKHIDEIHEGNKHAKCDICGKEFYEKSQLNRHSRIHGLDESKRQFCKKCGKGFLFEFNLKRHIVSIHGQQNENWHCSYCGKGFTQKSGLISHTCLTHLNLFQFSCNACNQSFSRAAMLKDHMAAYHNNLNFKITDHPTSPKKNIVYNRTAEEMHHCMYCSENFYSKAKLVVHIHGTHADAFPYQCTVCNQGFLESSFLQNHKAKVHGFHVECTEQVSAEDVGVKSDKNQILKSIIRKPGHKTTVVALDSIAEKHATTTMDVSDFVVDTVNTGTLSATEDPMPGDCNTGNYSIISPGVAAISCTSGVSGSSDVAGQSVGLPSDITEQISDIGQVADVQTDSAETDVTLLVEVDTGPTKYQYTGPTKYQYTGPTKYQYYIQAAESLNDDNSVHIAHEFANLLLAAEHSLQASEKSDSNASIPTTCIDASTTLSIADKSNSEHMQEESDRAVLHILGSGIEGAREMDIVEVDSLVPGSLVHVVETADGLHAVDVEETVILQAVDIEENS